MMRFHRPDKYGVTPPTIHANFDAGQGTITCKMAVLVQKISDVAHVHQTHHARPAIFHIVIKIITGLMHINLVWELHLVLVKNALHYGAFPVLPPAAMPFQYQNAISNQI